MSGASRIFSVIGGESDASAIKIAFATDDGKHVNQHFGTAKSLLIFNVQPGCHQLIAAAEFDDVGAASDGDKLAAKLNFLHGCIAVYCRACGASALKQLNDLHIQPLKVTERVRIKKLIAALQIELDGTPSHWLASALARRGDNLNPLMSEVTTHE